MLVEECGRDFFSVFGGTVPSPLKWRFAASILTRLLVNILHPFATVIKVTARD